MRRTPSPRRRNQERRVVDIPSPLSRRRREVRLDSLCPTTRGRRLDRRRVDSGVVEWAAEADSAVEREVPPSTTTISPPISIPSISISKLTSPRPLPPPRLSSPTSAQCPSTPAATSPPRRENINRKIFLLPLRLDRRGWPRRAERMGNRDSVHRAWRARSSRLRVDRLRDSNSVETSTKRLDILNASPRLLVVLPLLLSPSTPVPSPLKRPLSKLSSLPPNNNNSPPRHSTPPPLPPAK